MFKKPEDVAERGKTQLKKKAVSALKAELASQLRVSDEQLAEVMGSKTTVVEQSKLMSRSILYFVDSVPYFVDEGGRNKLMPTLQFLWKYPNAVRCFLIHSQVSSFVLNGANLMLPGVATLSGLEDIQVGEVMCVRVIDNPLPFAMGRSGCSWEGIMANNRRGKAMDVFHCFGDCLSQMAGGIHNNKGPNDGFVLGKKFILPLEGYKEGDLGELLIEPESDDEEHEEGEEGEGEEEGVGDVKGVGELSLNEAEEPGEPGAPAGSKKLKRFQLKKEGTEADGVGAVSREEASDAERTQMDGALWTCLVLLLKHYLKERSLPALINVTWPSVLRIGQYLRSKGDDAGLLLDSTSTSPSTSDSTGSGAARSGPVVADVEIKRSHHRTVAVFFDYAARQGLLSLSEPQPGVYGIAAINRTHLAFRQVRMANVDSFKAGVQALEGGGGGGGEGGSEGAGAGGGAGGAGGAVRVIIKDYYQMPRNVRAAFPALASPSNQLGVVSGKDQYFTAAHIKELLSNAFKEPGLVVAGDGAAVEVPVGHAMHALARSIAKRSNVPRGESGGGDEGGGGGGGAGAAVSGTTASSGQGQNEQPGDKERGDYYHYEEEEEDGEEDDEMGASAGGRVVGGVWCPDKVAAYPSAAAAPAPAAAAAPSVWRAPTASLGGKRAAAAVKAAPASAPASATVYSGGGGGGGGGKKEKKKSKKGNGSEDVFSADLPVRLRKDVFMKGLSSLLSPAHSVGHAEDAVPTFFGGRAPVVEVYVNQVMGKKKMTHIVGLERFGVDLDDLGRRLSKKFAASSSVGPNTQQPKLMEVVVQGHLAAEAVEFICATYSFPSKLLSVSLKKGVKAKKK